MPTSSERSDLELFLEEIGETTGLEVCLFDFKYFTKDALELQVDSDRRIHACEYCRVVKSNRKAWKRCIETEHWRAEVASSKEEPFRHTCYAGVTDLVVPLKRGPQLVGALYLGQVQCQSDLERERIIESLVNDYGLNREELRQTSARMHRRSSDDLTRYVPLLRGARRFVEQAIELVTFKYPDRADGRPVSGIRDVPIYFLERLHPSSQNIDQALRVIRTHYWESINQPDVAREVGMSNSQFSRVFHEETGMTFRECLMQVRLEAAGYLLKRSNLKVYQIAEMVGYQNNSSMQRAFRRLKGFTPLTFIRRQGEQEFCIKEE